MNNRRVTNRAPSACVGRWVLEAGESLIGEHVSSSSQTGDWSRSSRVRPGDSFLLPWPSASCSSAVSATRSNSAENLRSSIPGSAGATRGKVALAGGEAVEAVGSEASAVVGGEALVVVGGLLRAAPYALGCVTLILGVGW